MKRKTIIILACLLIGFSCSPGNEQRKAENQKPNIVLIISDDQGWNDYSFMGHEHIETPAIDQLAAEGLTFTYGYTAAPLCCPALASIATGLFPHQHGVFGNDPVFDFEGQRYSEEWTIARMEHFQKYIDSFEELDTIADVLGENGYSSLQTGKWWMGNYSNGGFDQGMTHGDPSRTGRHGDEGLKIAREGMDVIFDYIDSVSNDNKPFFIWYAPFLPHSPHNPPDNLKQKYLETAPTEAVASYWAMCEWFDISCGQLIDYIEQKGLSSNTLFVYVTDNGWIQDPDRPNRYAPRSKREPYEMGIRTPIIFRWKDNITPEMDTASAVSAIDIAATIYRICGIEPPEQLEGINVLDKDAVASRDTVFAETLAHDFTTLDSSLYYRIAVELPHKLILPDKTNKPGLEAELYNVLTDPFETENLAPSNPEKVEKLKGEIENWWEGE